MSNIVDKSYHPVLDYKWQPMGVERRPGTILSKMITFQGQKLFRAGLRNEVISSSLLFMTFGLPKMGLDDYAYVFVTGPRNTCQAMSLEIEEDEPPQRARSVQLYTAKLETMMAGDLSFTFHVCIRAKVPNYHAERIDLLLGQQLWSAAVNQRGTDLILFAQGIRFPVHKFILAARSFVFANQIQAIEAQQQEPLIAFPKKSILEQFLKFIYTGELVGEVSNPLWQLAVDYQVETLINICREAGLNRLNQEDHLNDDIARLALMLKANENNVPEIKPDVEAEINYQPNAFLFNTTWVIPPENQKFVSFSYEDSLVSGGFGIDSSNEMFSAKITANSIRQQFELFFLVHHTAERNCCTVQEVICCLDNGHRLQLQMVNPTAGERHNHMFIGAKPFQETKVPRKHIFPSTITFFVKLISTVPTHNFKMRDWLLPDHLWYAATIAKRMTDVEIIVGLDDPLVSFLAHRFILSARSPVFDAMLNGDFEEARTGTIRISDVHPDLFAHFFHFLYTGKLRPFIGEDRRLERDLFALADRYQVDTLMHICRPAPEGPVDVEQLMDSFLSC